MYIQRSSKHSTTRTEDFGNAVLVEPGRVANGKLERLRAKLKLPNCATRIRDQI